MNDKKKEYSEIFIELVSDAMEVQSRASIPIGAVDPAKLRAVAELYAEEMLLCNTMMSGSLGGDSHKRAAGVVKTLINTLYTDDVYTNRFVRSTNKNSIDDLEVTADLAFYVACSLCSLNYYAIRNDTQLNNGILAYLLDIKYNADIFSISCVLYLLEEACRNKGYIVQ